jgi:serine/threonine protein kinase
MSASLVGKQIGDYRLNSILASGGMARIYRAVDLKLEREVAVKVLTPEQVESDPTLAERFEREARAVAHLEHENIIPIYRYGVQDNLHYLSMKLIEGEDLADEMNRLRGQFKLMDPKRMLHIMGQIASALDYAHQHNVIHRDIKPSNILIDKTDKAILTDFGLVLRTEIDKTMGTAFGTPRYIAPEQALASEKAVPQSDIYSLAVIVFEILTGTMLFKADTAMQIALAHIGERPPEPRTVNPDIPLAVEIEVLRALEKEPARRHKTATQFVNALREAYGEDVEDSRTDMPEAVKSHTPVFKPGEVTAFQEEAREPIVNTPMPDEPTIAGNVKSQPMPSRSRQSVGMLIGVVLALVVIVGAGLVFAGGASPAPTPTTVAMTDNSPTAQPTMAAAVEPTTQRLAETGDPMLLAVYYEFNVLALRNNGEVAMDVSQLRLARADGSDPLDGSSVTGQVLEPGECVVVMLQGHPVETPEDWNCATVRNQIQRQTSGLFWRTTADSDAFTITYTGESRQSCAAVGRGGAESCTATLPQSAD